MGRGWLRQFSNPDADEPMDPAWRVWVQAMYADRGALSPAEVEPLAVAELLNRARDAGKLVGADASGTLGQPSDITAGSIPRGFEWSRTARSRMAPA
jgi:hypothetical protein